MLNNLAVMEALLFASEVPLSSERLREIIGLAGTREVEEAVLKLNQKYLEADHAFRIREIAGGFQVYTLPEYSSWIETMLQETKRQRLSKAALETLSIIAYKQPVTKVEIDRIRGVQSDASLKNILEKELATIIGRAGSVGRPLLYGTTEHFLILFGLKDINELPRLEEMEFVTGPAPLGLPLVASEEMPLPITPVEAESVLSDPG